MATTAADVVLDELTEITPLTQHGKSWMTVCIDPLHDFEVANVQGFPDGSGSRSVVQRIRQTVNISKPAGLNTGPWDAHLIQFPHVNAVQYSKGYTLQRVTLGGINRGDNPVFFSVGNINPSGSVGGVCVYANNVNDNKNNPFDNTVGAPLLAACTTLSPDATFLKGNYRVISQGYEVSSVGPALYRSGSVTCWRQPSASTPDSLTYQMKNVALTGADVVVGVAPVVAYEYPPNSIAQAALIPNSKTWLAEDGVYQPSILNTDGLFSINSQDQGFVYRGADVIGNANLQYSIASFFSGSNVTIPGNSGSSSYFGLNTTSAFPFSHSGAYFSGLNENDVLCVTAIWYIERFPGANQSDLQTLASPSAVYDPTAFEMYSRMTEVMPVAMKFNANGFGDWFKDAIAIVTDTVAPVLSAMPGPLGAVAKGITAASKVVKTLTGSNDSPSPNTNNLESTDVPAQQAINELEKATKMNKTPASLPRSSGAPVQKTMRKIEKKENKLLKKIGKTTKTLKKKNRL